MSWRQIFTFFFLGFCFAEAQNEVTQVEKQLIQGVLTQFPDNTHFAIALVQDGQTSFYGCVKKPNGLVEVDNRKNLFEVGSISKVFTATLLANAVLEGKVELNASINDHLGFDINNGYEFTFLQLANHTSGLPRMPGNFIFHTNDAQNPYKDYDENALIEFLEKYVTLLNYEKREYEYSNLGAGFLGYLLTKINDQSYHTLLESKVFQKLRMVDSYGYVPRNHENLVKGRNEKGEVTSNWDLNILAGAGAVVSNVEDMSKFILAQFDISDKALVLTREETHKMDEHSAIALGWHINKKVTSEPIFWHNGGTGGYRSCMAINIDNKRGVIVLSNVSAFHKESSKIDNLSFDLLKTLN